MPSLLHISASPRGDRSESLAIAHTFLDRLRDRRPDINIETFDLWTAPFRPSGRRRQPPR
jgi:FMN-dependent NADH-azoreductase